jgi:4-hydroxybenzoate polyprenyltransferase
LLLPCWWSVALAVVAAKGNTPIAVSFVFFFSVFTLPNPIYLLLFFIGAFAMGGAGCTWNDILDRNIDAQVARTRARPIPSGQAPSGASTYSLGVRIS